MANTTKPKAQRWTDINGLSELYGWPVDTIRSWRLRGIAPPAYKVNGRLMFDLDEVDEWVRARRAA